MALLLSVPVAIVIAVRAHDCMCCDRRQDDWRYIVIVSAVVGGVHLRCVAGSPRLCWRGRLAGVGGRRRDKGWRVICGRLGGRVGVACVCIRDMLFLRFYFFLASGMDHQARYQKIHRQRADGHSLGIRQLTHE